MRYIEPLASFPTPGYVTTNSAPHVGHAHAKMATSGPARELRDLADVIYAQAHHAGQDGERDWTRSVIVHDLLEVFDELLNYETGGWDGGMCDSWARSVGEYIGQPLD